jgi:excisionase family DNA binding protein
MVTTFLRATEIAQILKISKALAYRLMAQGQINSIRFGRVVRVRLEDLEDFIQRNMTKPLVQIGRGVPDNFDLKKEKEHN